MDLSSYKSEKGFSAGYGLGDLVWHSTFQYFYDSTDVFYYSQGFRFIGEKENDYARWSAGDTINLFSLDLYNKVYTDNPDFILAGAIELTIGSAVIAASVFLM